MSPIKHDAASDSFNEIATVRIELRHTDPSIWRQVEVPTSITLKVLHDIIQAVMGWFNYHLWEFTIGKQRYGLPMDDTGELRLRSRRRRCACATCSSRERPSSITPNDFGDGWGHRLTVTGVRAGEPGVSYPRYIGGERNGPPEDCGGIPGFYQLLEVLADPAHPDHAFLKQWAGDYDPDMFDALPIKYALGRIANRRNAARARIAKKKHSSAA
jgi:hypothetical protein